MKNLSEKLIYDLIKSGVNTFFGIQGGACARLIENVVKYKGKFIPVLNEQSAGYYAHGYYMATGKTAGLIFTTGPGLTNAVSGIAACYYDRVPLITLVGQVPKRLNISKKTKTRMVGFQEVPHLDICKPISDKTLKITNILDYKNNSFELLKNLKSKVQVLEILDDVQRVRLPNNYSVKKNLSPKNKKELLIKKNILKTIQASQNPIILIGAGFYKSKNIDKLIQKIKKLNIKTACTWGGQRLQKFFSKKENFIGIFGNHNPGLANMNIKNSDLIISLGCSLLQHQVGKNHDDFAPKAKLIYVNNDKFECKRARFQFGKRLQPIHTNVDNFISQISGLRKSLSNPIKFEKKSNEIYPVLFLKNFFQKLKKNSLIFSDAGATLSWSYQAANNVEKCPSVFTSFNLHSMGYANCASVGAAIDKKEIFCIIGDGSIPMNSQELSWLKQYKVKMIILDNKGYGIIRQTQRQFYKSNFIGSDFKNKKASMPNFNVKSILESYDIPLRKIENKKLEKKNISWLLNKKTSCALIVSIDYKHQVIT